VSDSSRAIDLSVEVPGSPEQVWEAIASGPGITSWFVPHTVEGRAGGQVTMDFGPGYGVATAEVAVWEPPHRLVLRSEGEQPLAYEWLVEARSGGTCVVRLVNSGFGTGDDWDAQYDGMDTGWRLFLENLRLHQERFPGQAARSVVPTHMLPGGRETAFARVCAALGIPADLDEGAGFRTAGSGVPTLSGTVDRVLRLPRATAYLLVLDEPAPGHGILAAEGTSDAVAVSLYLYLYGERAAQLPDPVSPFLAERFGAAPVAERSESGQRS
jgi:uncharacterized protein YndB with AHSA1/START domain